LLSAIIKSIIKQHAQLMMVFTANHLADTDKQISCRKILKLNTTQKSKKKRKIGPTAKQN